MYFVYIQNTNYVFVFKYIFSHSILYLYLNKQFQTVFCIFFFNTFWFICAHLCPWHSWAQEYFQKPLLVNTIRSAIWRCQLNLYHAKRKPYVNMVQKCCHVLWVKAHSKFTFSKWKSILWSDESKLYIPVGNHGRRFLQAEEEGDLSACHQCLVQKPASLIVWGVHMCIRYGSLHVLEGTMIAERYIKVLEQHMLPSRGHLFQGRPCVFQQDNAKPMYCSYYNSMAS